MEIIWWKWVLGGTHCYLYANDALFVWISNLVFASECYQDGKWWECSWRMSMEQSERKGAECLWLVGWRKKRWKMDYEFHIFGRLLTDLLILWLKVRICIISLITPTNNNMTNHYLKLRLSNFEIWLRSMHQRIPQLTLNNNGYLNNLKLRIYKQLYWNNIEIEMKSKSSSLPTRFKNSEISHYLKLRTLGKRLRRDINNLHSYST